MESQITIYDKSGGELLKVPVTRTSIRKRVLMSENHVLLVFNHDSYIDFRKGNYIIYKGFKFEIMTDVYPEMYRNGWKYSLQFDAKDGFLRKYNIFYRKQDITEVAFALTTDLLSFGNVICDCINHELGGTNWRVKAIPVEYTNLMKTISFKGEKLFDALTMVAQQFECEWWIEENGNFVDLCFGKLSFGTEEEFEEGKVVTSIPRKAGDDSDFGTRFFVYGSTRNLTSDYGQVEQGGTTNHISEIRLRLPNGLNYIDAWENLSPEDVVHQVVFLDDVYPKNKDVITKVETAPREIEGSKETFDAYIITAENTPFVPSDVIEGETLGCVFETGALQGQSFELKINYDPETWRPSEGFDKRFEIVHVMNGDIIVPNKSFKPEVGDKFVITGVRLPKERIREAEQELLQVGQAWAKKKSQDTSVYDCPTNPVFCQENEKNYDLGQKVKLVGDRFGVSGRSSRIQGYEKKLWNEYEATYTVGDNSSYSRLKQIEGEIKESQYSERIGVVNGVGIYLIRNKFDNTQPTNYNAYSALATLEKFVTYAGYVNQPVRTVDDVKFKSLQTTSYIPGLTGTGARIDEKGYAEMTGVILREFLEVPELRFNRVDVISGEQWNSPGFGLIENVDVVNCIATLKLEDKELTGIDVNDICRGIFHNLTGNADGLVKDGCGFQTMPGFSTSYFTPIELLEDGKSFKYELKPGTTVHPSPAMKFAVYGNFTNKSRQASAYSTRTYKRYLKDVNTWEIDPQRNIAMQFGDLSGMVINGMSMEGYSAYLNNIYFSGYMQFTPGQLEEIKGKDGYSVNLTSYDAVVAVDSEGRVDSSVYDIINVVNGSELVKTDGSQVVTTRYKIQTEIQAYQGKTRLVYDETPGVGQYSAVFTARGCEYSFAGGVLTITKITEDKASVEIEVNCEGTAVFTMTFTLTRVYGGVNADWPSYVFKQSEEKPEPPTGTDPYPTGWEDAPSSVGKWWMSKATISGVTGLAGPWSDPVQVTAEDGNNGKDGEYVIYEYAVNYSETVAPSSGWSRTVPGKSPGQYLWMRWGTVVPPATNPVTWEGIARVTGEKGEQGDPGMPGKYTKLAYQYGFSQPSAPSGFSPQGWMDTPDKEKITFTHGSTFTLKDGWYVSPKISSNGFTTNRISFTTRQSNQMVFINLRVSSEKYDYAYVGALDKNLAKDVNYIDRLGGEVDKVLSVIVPSAGSHFIDIGYGKDSSIDIGEDCCRYRMADCGQCWLSTCECVWMDSGYAAGSWTTPVPFITDTPDKEEIYLLSDSAQKPSTPESAAYMDDFVPALTKKEYKSSVANAIGDIVRSGDEFYVCLKANTGQALTNSEYWKKVPGWTDNPSGVSDIYPYEYIATRKKADGKWGSFSAPTIWAKFGQDGKDAISVYKASVSQPATPSGATVPPSGWSLTPPVRQTGEFIWVSSPIYDSNNNITGWSVPTKFSGDVGAAGQQGMICRVSEWSAGVYYRNDKDTVTDGLRYLDVVVVTNKDTGSFLCYEATAAHNGVVSSESNKPGNDTFWLRMTELPPVYTPLILAENGVIRFAQSNQLLIQKEDGTITAGASGKGDGSEGIRFWAGADDPSLAPWRVDENGKMVAKNADITGNIKATSGQIGEWVIDSNKLKSQDFSPAIYVKDGATEGGAGALISAKGSLMLVCTDSGVLAPSTGFKQAALIKAEGENAGICGMDIIVKSTSATNPAEITALKLSATTNYESTLSHKELALEIMAGDIKMTGNSVINGFGLNVRRVTTSTTLTAEDDIIIVAADSGITITLPGTRPALKKGKMFWIRKCGSGNITVSGIIMSNWDNTTSSVVIKNAVLEIYIFTGGYWTRNSIA